MQGLPLKRFTIAGALLAACLAPAVAAKDAGSDRMPAHMTLTFDGPILVNQAGMALYTAANEDMAAQRVAWRCTNAPPTRTNDQQSGLGERPNIGYTLLKSCADKYPPYLAEANAAPVGDYTIVQRPDGAKQWAYRNYPLYTSIKDHKPGDRNGAYSGSGYSGRGTGMRLAWQAMNLPIGLKFSRREEGLVLVATALDRPLYTPREGAHVRLASAGGPAFDPILAPAVATVSGDWSIVQAAAGQKQYAFRGKPLFVGPTTIDEAEFKAAGWELVVAAKGPSVPSAIGKQLSLVGEVYTNKDGMTLYAYNCNAGSGAGGPRVQAVSCEEAGDPAAWLVAVCGDGKECARRWRPYIAPANAKPEGEFSVVDITYPMFTDMRGLLYPADAPRVKAWAYRGKPLFTYYTDEKPGDIYGHNVSGLWGSGFAAIEVPGKSAIFEP